MLFRPEEMDATSCESPIFSPSTQRYIDIATNAYRVFIFNYAIAYNNLHKIATV